MMESLSSTIKMFLAIDVAGFSANLQTSRIITLDAASFRVSSCFDIAFQMIAIFRLRNAQP